jgi:hypothetical protein
MTSSRLRDGASEALSPPSPGLVSAPHCWTVVPPDRSVSGHVEVLAAVDATVLTIDEVETVDQVGQTTVSNPTAPPPLTSTRGRLAAPFPRTVHPHHSIAQRQVLGALDRHVQPVGGVVRLCPQPLRGGRDVSARYSGRSR